MIANYALASCAFLILLTARCVVAAQSVSSGYGANTDLPVAGL